ncbi:MAG TPA: galactokinase family protein [Marmoricola sp.]|nr:galactokinase family protein [Marmoricola sp.]
MDQVIASAPGRVNLIGEHLDYNGGRCLPIALPCRTTVVAAPSTAGQLTISSGGVSWAGLPGERAEGWAAYVAGVLWALDLEVALDLSVTSDVPIGAGLSSSAALECATAVAVDALLGLGRSRDEIAAACVRAETEYVGAPTGGLDQTTAMFAERDQALLLDFSDGSRSLVRFDPGAVGLSLLVVDTGVTHELSGAQGDGGYAARRTDCERAAEILGVESLAAVSDPESALTTLHDARLRRRAAHVFSEQQRVDDVVAALGLGDWAEVGAAMTSSHESLRDDFEVSCPELDAVVSAALDAGALGARMTGGGFGGSAIVLTADPERARSAVNAAFTTNRWADPTYLDGRASAGARVEDPGR